MEDRDDVQLTGIIVETPIWQETPAGKKALNFVVETLKRFGPEEKRFKHQVTAWGAIAEKYRDKVKVGAFVDIRGNLQATVLHFKDDAGIERTYYCDRTNAKHMIFEED